MKRVGSSEVSAITQTPASGPCAPVTTPPMSLPSIATGAGLAGCARSGVAPIAIAPAMIVANPRRNACVCAIRLSSRCQYLVLALFLLGGAHAGAEPQSPGHRPGSLCVYPGIVAGFAQELG